MPKVLSKDLARLSAIDGGVTRWGCGIGLALIAIFAGGTIAAEGLPKVRVAADGRGFVAVDGKAFLPFGVNYFRPGTGWAPQVWRQFDPEATRRDFAKLRELGGNCVRVFLTYGSFLQAPEKIEEEGLAKLDRFVALAEEAGIYVHPTGPDHWEGLPEWARTDRIADDRVLEALERFWGQLAKRYRGRGAVFAYDLLNEPEVGWDTPAMRPKWNAWLLRRHGSLPRIAAAWGTPERELQSGQVPAPPKEAPPGPELLDYQHFRESLAEEWTRRQVAAIREADPEALVTVGLIQWSVPVGIAGAWHYSAFRPERQAPLLDFMEVHFYPLANGFYAYRDLEDEQRNLAYLECVVREVARFGKPTVIAEFGWYGGGKPSIDQGVHPFATEDQQARWGRKLVESTAGPVVGWLNWSLHDHPEARDVTEFIGLLTATGEVKAWGRDFATLSKRLADLPAAVRQSGARPVFEWDRLITDRGYREEARRGYFEAWKLDSK